MSPRQAPRDLRASDADRDRVLALLAEAASDGRLTAEEHAERVQRAFAARTLGELAELTADLAVPSAQPVRLDGGRVDRRDLRPGPARRPLGGAGEPHRDRHVRRGGGGLHPGDPAGQPGAAVRDGVRRAAAADRARRGVRDRERAHGARPQARRHAAARQARHPGDRGQGAGPRRRARSSAPRPGAAGSACGAAASARSAEVDRASRRAASTAGARSGCCGSCPTASA